jgi:hypothetical protein
MIAEKPEAVDNALAEFLDTIKNMLPVYFHLIHFSERVLEASLQLGGLDYTQEKTARHHNLAYY